MKWLDRLADRVDLDVVIGIAMYVVIFAGITWAVL